MKPVRLAAFLLTLTWCTASTIVERAPFNVRAFGATGNGTTKDTAAFQKALDTCAVAGGGTVIVPAGNYLVGSVELKSRTILVLEQDAHLLGSPDLEDYPVIKVRWEGKWIDGHRALISAHDADHIAIIGPGKISGNPALADGKCRAVRSSSSQSIARMSDWKVFPPNITACGPSIPRTVKM